MAEGGGEGEVFVFVVEDGHDVGEAVVEEADDVVDVLLAFVAVADDEDVFGDEPLGVELLDEVDVECRGGLEVDVVFEGFFEDEAEVAGLGAVAVVVGAFVVGLGYSDVEHALGTLYLRGYFGQIGYLEGCPVLLDDFHEGDVVEVELAVFRAEFILRKIEGLVDQIVVFIFHPSELVCLKNYYPS